MEAKESIPRVAPLSGASEPTGQGLPPRPDAGGGALRDTALLVILAGFLFTLALGINPAHRIQEVRVLEVSREMFASGDWIVPRFLGEFRLVKFPLAYWLCLAGYQLTGHVGEFSGRLFSGLAGVLTVLLAYALGRRLGSRRLALWCAIILATSPLFFRFARYAETDGLMTCGTTAALYAFFRAFAEAGITPGRRSLWTILGWGAMGIAFLAKGPAGLLMPLISVILYLAAGRQWRDILRLFHPAGVLLLAIMVVPWPLAVYLRTGSFFDVMREQAESTMSGKVHGRTFFTALFFYPSKTSSDFAPWWVLLIPAVAAAARGGLRRNRKVGFILAWAGGIVLQLCFVGNKQTHYILPAYPAFAALVAWWADEEASRWSWLRDPRPRLLVAILAAAMVVLLPVWIFAGWALEKKADYCRDFALAAKAVVGNAPVFLHGDPVPEVVFYLGKLIPQAGPGPAGMDELLRQHKEFFVLARIESRKGEPDHDAALRADGRFRVVLESSKDQLPLRLYGPVGSP